MFDLGATKEMIDDFWRMVWEQNVDTIVMLNKPIEKGRVCMENNSWFVYPLLFIHFHTRYFIFLCMTQT